jgi:hypothetical protein
MSDTHDILACDWPSPEELTQWMAEDLIVRCGGDYIAAHAAVDGYDTHNYYPLASVMAVVEPLLMWCDKTEAHDEIERHRQMQFAW